MKPGRRLLERIRDWISIKVLREPASQPIYWTMASVYLSRALYVAAKLRIADLLINRAMTPSELAAKTETNEKSLVRMMDTLAAFGIFRKEPDNMYAMTPAAQPLSSFVDGPVRDWVLFVGHQANWMAYGLAEDCVKRGKSGFELAHGMPIYDYMAEHPEFGECFRGGMDGWSRWQGKVIVETYDFSAYGTVVDIGGGRGGLMKEILLSNSGSKGILLDCLELIERATENLKRAGVAGRCEFRSGSFFDELPGSGDAYVLKHVLRDWSDEDAGRILRNCRNAMLRGSKLVLIEGVIDPARGKDRLQRLIDLEQMFWLDGKMRTREEWLELLSSHGFSHSSTRFTGIADTAILEFDPA